MIELVSHPSADISNHILSNLLFPSLLLTHPLYEKILVMSCMENCYHCMKWAVRYQPVQLSTALNSPSHYDIVIWAMVQVSTHCLHHGKLWTEQWKYQGLIFFYGNMWINTVHTKKSKAKQLQLQIDPCENCYHTKVILLSFLLLSSFIKLKIILFSSKIEGIYLKGSAYIES